MQEYLILFFEAKAVSPMLAYSVLIQRNLKEGRAYTCQDDITNSRISYLIFEDYIKYRSFLIKIKEAPLGNMVISMYNDFQQLFCKILSENQPVVKLVNANEQFLSQSPTTCQIASDIKIIISKKF